MDSPVAWTVGLYLAACDVGPVFDLVSHLFREFSSYCKDALQEVPIGSQWVDFLS